MDKKRSKKERRMEKLRGILLGKQKQIERRIAQEIGEKVAEDIKAKMGPSLDEGDLSLAEEFRNVDFGILTLYYETLRDIREALDKLEKGMYGYCEECGEEISGKRLEAMPFTRYCIDCQREYESSRISDQRPDWLERRAQIEQAREDKEEDVS
jgi:DnaK suppressor protein